MPRLAIVGYGRSGKDECGIWLGRYTQLRYSGSTSNIICPLIADELGITIEEAWEHRHRHREFWFNWANKYRENDPGKLSRLALSQGDLVVGLRAKEELEACRKERLVDLIIWIHRPGRVDSTVKFTASDCDVVLDNSTTLAQFHYRIYRLCKFSGIHTSCSFDLECS